MAMTLDAVKAQVEEWAASVNGKYVDFDGAFGAQCVDPALHYGDTVHGFSRILGHGIALAGNYIATYGWARVSASAIQPGDMVSLNWGGAYGHVLIALSKLADGRWRILDQNSRGTGDRPSGPCEIRTVSLSSGVVRVARPPRYVGATSSEPAPAKTPAKVLGESLSNVDALIAASRNSGVPLHIAAALISKESAGRNIYGHDYKGVFSTNPSGFALDGRWYDPGDDVVVTASNYKLFLGQILSGNSWTGRTSNGVGPAQITFWSLHADARDRGFDLSKPVDNMTYGLRVLAGYLGGNYSQSSVERAGTSYNAGASSSINAYGRDLWKRSEEYRVALEGATGTAPAPAPEADGNPAMPGLDVTVDPGPLPSLADLPDGPVPPLPDPSPGPVVPGGDFTVPLARVLFRGAWWSPLNVEVRRGLQIPGPDQSPLGARIMSATGTVVLARPAPVSDRGWSVWLDDPPRHREPVTVQFSEDGGDTWHTKLVGMVWGTSSSVTDLGIEVEVTDLTRRLGVPISHDPLNFRHPSPVDGWPYMRIGLHPVFYANLVARAGGFYCTPPTRRSVTLVSSPMVGSVWPERGRLTMSKTLDAKGATAGVASDSPEYRRTWWGLTVHNIFAVIEPTVPDGLTGGMDTPIGVRALVGPVTSTISAVELWWDRVSITTMVSTNGVAVEVQSGWNANGTRRVHHRSVHPLTPQQIERGFEMRVWYSPSGTITVHADDEVSAHAQSQPWPVEVRTSAMSDVRVLAPAKGAPLGGVQVVSDSKESALPSWERTFFPDVDPDHMLWGGLAIDRKDGLELIREMAECALDSAWVDEVGYFHYVSRRRMDARPSAQTLTLSDLTDAPVKVPGDSVYTAVTVTGREPTLTQNRFDSRAWTQVWEGPRDTIAPGGVWASIVTIPDDEDWFWVDGSFEDVTPASVADTNRGIGSWVGGTSIFETPDGPVERAAPQSWFAGTAARVTQRTLRVKFGHTPPDGVDADLSLTVPEYPGLHKRRVGNGPIMRARGRQTWSDARPLTRSTGAVMESPEIYEHSGGMWVQSQLQARQVANRLAGMLASPIPSWGPVGLLRPMLHLRLGETISLEVHGVTKPQRIAGDTISFTADEGLSRSLTLRQIRP